MNWPSSWPPHATAEKKASAEELKVSLREWSDYLALKKIGSQPPEPKSRKPDLVASFEVCEYVWLDLFTSQEADAFERVVDGLAAIRLGVTPK